MLLKAAELLATTWRATLNAATMLGQSQDRRSRPRSTRCELIDFWRFNPAYAQELYDEQPLSRPRDVEPARLPAARGVRLRGHAVQLHGHRRQPAHRARADGQHGGLEAGRHARCSRRTTSCGCSRRRGCRPASSTSCPATRPRSRTSRSTHRDLAGIHFTGCTAVFNAMWQTVGGNMSRYRSYPRIVGETGGKDFIVAHASADVQALAVAIARGGFEYQGQKCSAASRVYVPRSMWTDVRDRTVAMLQEIRMGDVADFRNFMGAVIDSKAFDKIGEYMDDAAGARGWSPAARRRTSDGYFIAHAGGGGGSRVSPAVRGDLRPRGHRTRLRRRAVGGDTARSWTDLALRADGRGVRAGPARRARGASALRNAAGNFYINDKPTGAVVGQQPFGGARASGTNDKAGSKLNLVRWVSARTIKEKFAPAARLPLSVHGRGVARRAATSSSSSCWSGS